MEYIPTSRSPRKRRRPYEGSEGILFLGGTLDFCVALLNDTVIEGYLRLIERRNQEGLHGFPTFLGLDTFYMKDLENGHFNRAGIGSLSLFTPTPNGSRLSIRWVALTYQQRKELHDIGRYAQSHDLDCPRQQNNVDCGVSLTWFAERLSRLQPIETRQLNTLVWRVHTEEVLRTSRLGAFDGHLAECEKLLDPDFLNAEAWDILECGVEDDTYRPRTEVPSRLELEYDAFMAELNEACEEYTKEVPANTISGISVDDRNFSLLIFDDDNWLDILRLPTLYRP
ncbi:hypothetical protein J6590_089645 [Homalodisca vitripennis]|nr:hypothetical protein J6590_089645 [Homalodisca vitripennis]